MTTYDDLRRRGLNPVEAIRLYNQGRSWAEVGRIIAQLNQRRSPYQGEYVRRVVRDYDRGKNQD